MALRDSVVAALFLLVDLFWLGCYEQISSLEWTINHGKGVWAPGLSASPDEITLVSAF